MRHRKIYMPWKKILNFFLIKIIVVCFIYFVEPVFEFKVKIVKKLWRQKNTFFFNDTNDDK